jgi:uncharacterized protein (TIGR00290 family)
MRQKALLSWSSGKDSAWSLHVLRQQGEFEVVALLTTINEAHDRVAMHAVRTELLRTQAEAAGVPLWPIAIPWPCSNADYEGAMSAALARARDAGITVAAFGDLFLEDIRRYREERLSGTGVAPVFPLWGIPTEKLARDMLAGGLRARITCVDPKQLARSFAGREFDAALLDDLPPSVDPCGERGEFHTFAYDGPMFRRPVALRGGEIVERDGFVFADLVPDGSVTDEPAPRRIVSLLASGTELVCALGAGDRLVGRSHECDYPPWVKELPAVSRPTFEITGSSREIDEHVRTRLRTGQPLYEVDEASIAALAPDVLITQTHCEVCAVSPGDLAHGASARLVRKQVVALRTGSLDAILEGFLEVARVLHLGPVGEALVADIRAKLAVLSEKTRALAHPSVVCLEWIDPVFAMGNWGPELVNLAGGSEALGTPGVHSAGIPWDAVRQADPEVLVVAPCGFGLERAAAEIHLLAERTGWRDLRSVRSGRVFVADGNLYFNRSGPSVFETPEILAEMLHPRDFAPRHQGTVWRRWG